MKWTEIIDQVNQGWERVLCWVILYTVYLAGCVTFGVIIIIVPLEQYLGMMLLCARGEVR